MKRARRLFDDERATIVAALIFYAEEGMGEPDNRSNMIHELATENDVTSLDDAAIRELAADIRRKKVG